MLLLRREDDGRIHFSALSPLLFRLLNWSPRMPAATGTSHAATRERSRQTD
jgi:hypothetical protein